MDALGYLAFDRLLAYFHDEKPDTKTIRPPPGTGSSATGYQFVIGRKAICPLSATVYGPYMFRSTAGSKRS
jgi:hypothetical protein